MQHFHCLYYPIGHTWLTSYNVCKMWSLRRCLVWERAATLRQSISFYINWRRARRRTDGRYIQKILGEARNNIEDSGTDWTLILRGAV